MNIIHQKKKARFYFLFLLLTLFLTNPGYVNAFENEEEVNTQVSFGLAIMFPGVSRTFNVESDTLFNTMIIPVIAWDSSTLSITVSKTDSTGEIIAVMQSGYGHPSSGYNIGVTPRSLQLSVRVWDYATLTIYTALLFSLEEGPIYVFCQFILLISMPWKRQEIPLTLVSNLTKTKLHRQKAGGGLSMLKKTTILSAIIIGALLFNGNSELSAQMKFFDGRLSALVKFDEYISVREKRDKSQKVQFDQRITLWRHRAQTELLFNITETDDTLINFYLWLQYYYEMAPDFNRKLRRAIPAGARYKNYQAPFWDSDDIIAEMYLDVNQGPWTFRVGKQKVVWGEMTLQRTTDVINPLDLRYSSPGIDDFDELKMAVWMMRVMYDSDLPGDLAFEFVYNPGDYQQIRTGIQGTDRGVPSVPNEELGGTGILGAQQELRDKSEPRFAIDNYELGFRIRGLYNTEIAGEHYEFLWSLMYFTALDDSMIVDRIDDYNAWAGPFAVARTDGVIRGLPTKNLYDAKRFHMFGFGLQVYDNLLTKSVITSEYAYFAGIDYNKTIPRSDVDSPSNNPRVGKIERDYFTYGLMFDRSFQTRFIKKMFPKSEGFVSANFSIYQGWVLGNVSRVWRRFSYGERSETAFSTRLMTHFLNQTFTPVLTVLYNIDNWGYWSLSCSFSVTSRFKFSVGFTENWGSDRDDNGVASSYNKDRLWTKIIYQF